jgi:cation transport ATPase
MNGDQVLVGRWQWLRDYGIAEGCEAQVDVPETAGWSLIFVARNRQCLGWVGLQDQTRPEAKASVAALRELGVRCLALVSGDRAPVASQVARDVGCDQVRGDCLPQHKVKFVRQTRAMINQNFLLGIAFVIGGLVLSALKFLTPILAAILHVTGSLPVVFNSFRLLREGEELAPHVPASVQPDTA